MTIMPDRCRYCECAEGSLCRYCKATFDDSSWHDKTRTVCGNPECAARYENARAKAKAESRPPRRTSADIHQLIRSGNRKKKRRAA